MTLKFETRTYPGYNTKQNGRHPTELVMAVIGDRGAMVWRMATGVTPIGYHTSSFDRSHSYTLYHFEGSEPSDMGLCAHSELNERTMRDTESSVTASCEWFEGRACVCDFYTGLAGEELFPAFAAEGFDGVKRVLTRYYREYYGKED